MSNLRITFQQMFLLVNRLDGATVLTPSTGHTTTLSGLILDAPIILTGVDVLIRRDSVDLVGTPTLKPGARYLPFLDYVFHADVTPMPSSRAVVVPPDVSARVLLSGGYLTELPAADKNVAELQWQFVKPDNQVVLTQALTDRLLFTLPLDPGVAYELVIRGKDNEQRFPIPDDGADLLLVNADNPKTKQGAVDGWHTLKEYTLLYNLTTASTLETLYPYPTAYTGGVTGGDQPICGGGQTDDGDPPPP